MSEIYRFGLDADRPPDAEQWRRLMRFIEALLNNPHLHIGDRNSEVIFPPQQVVEVLRKPTSAPGSSSSGSSGSSDDDDSSGDSDDSSGDDPSDSSGSSSSSDDDGGPCAPTVEIEATVYFPDCFKPSHQKPFEVWIGYTVTIGPKPEDCECPSDQVAVSIRVAGNPLPSRSLGYDSNYSGYENFALLSATGNIQVEAKVSGVLNPSISGDDCAWQVVETIYIPAPGYCE